MLLLAAQTAGWVPVREDARVGLVLASFVFPLEGLACIIAFLVRDTLAATVLGLFTTSWLTIGLAVITGEPGATVLSLGFYLFAFAAAVVALAARAAMAKPSIALVLSLSAARAILDGLYEVSKSTSAAYAAGYVVAVIAGVAWYGGTAFALEDLRQTSVLPVFRRGAGQAAMEAPTADQVARVFGEAGIRQQV